MKLDSFSTSTLHKLYSPAASYQEKDSPVPAKQASAWAYSRIGRFGEYIYDYKFLSEIAD